YGGGGWVDRGKRGLVAGGGTKPLERGQGVLVGHGRVAEGRAAVADLVPIEDLVVVVEVRAGPPDLVVRGVVGDGVPPGLAEGVAEREPLAGQELAVPLVAVDPH